MTANFTSFTAHQSPSETARQNTAPADLLAEGLRLFDAADFEGAARCCQTILAAQPGNAAAHHLSGQIQIEAGHAGRAVAHLRQAMRLEPENDTYLYALGQALAATGELEPASRCFTLLTERSIPMSELNLRLGDVRRTQGRTVEAVSHYWQATKSAVTAADAYCGLGAALADLRYYDAAHRQVARALELNPGLAIASNHLALLPSTDSDASATCELGLALAASGHADDAIAALEDAVSKKDTNTTCLMTLAALYRDMDRLDAAISTYRGLLAKKADDAEALAGLGAALAAACRYEEAEASLLQALALAPHMAEARKNLAKLHLEMDRPLDALADCDAALEVKADYVEAHTCRAIALLGLGDYDEGWPAYEWRRRMPRNAPAKVSLPEWNGEPLAGRRLHVISEQAAGDAVMFATCLAELATLDGPVTFHCQSRIAALMARAFPWLSVDARLPAEGATGLAVCLGSLPLLFRHGDADFEGGAPYMIADNSAVARWRARYADLGAGLKVGFSWRGGSKGVERQKRGSQLSDWIPLLKAEGTQFVDLQYGDQTEERAALRNDLGVALYQPQDDEPGSDMDGFAARIAALDLVVSMDNTTVHFAGALGVPVWTLVPSAASWRWQRKRGDTPWYPTMQLVRQAKGEAWSAVLKRTANKLDALIAHPGPFTQPVFGNEAGSGIARSEPASNAFKSQAEIFTHDEVGT